MAPKTVKVKEHPRSSPSTPAFQGSGKKPGPKPVSVESHRRSSPKN